MSSGLGGFLIDFSDLLPGDILLFRPIQAHKIQKKIATKTDSPYTHAAIFLGDSEIAEAAGPSSGVQLRKLSDEDKQEYIIGVLRSQMVFSKRRSAELREFVAKLLKQGAKYDWRAALTWEQARSKYISTVLERLEKDYGKVTTKDEFAKKDYFCSALVVACYTVTGIIDQTAHAAYPPEVFSPADLIGDPCFGWLLGYVTKDGQVPDNDPLSGLAQWRCHQDIQWWRNGNTQPD